MSGESRTTGRIGEAVVARSTSDEEILRAVHNVRYGSVEITIHDSKVVQVERREKIRFQDQKDK